MTAKKKAREKAGGHEAKSATSADCSAKEAREKGGFSQAEAAVLADCALTTWRIFEIDPDALTPKKRAGCETALAVIRSKIEAA